MKLKVLFIIALTVTSLIAKTNPFILSHDGLIDQRAQDKILEIGQELKSKLNVAVFVHVKEDNGINMDLPREQRITQMREFDKFIIKKASSSNASYAVLVLTINQLYANILMSDDLKKVIDKDDILDGYVIPLLASKDKNSLFAKTSAASLNGFAQIADSIAESKQIKLESSIGSEGKTAGTIWKVFMYTLVLIGIGTYTIIIMKQRKAS